MALHACTIVARNYLPAHRVFAKSFQEQHPSSGFTVLVVDDTNEEVIEVEEPFDVLRLHDIGIEADEALRMAAIYDVTELCTAVKPWLLRTLLEAGADAVTYLDPDIKVFARLDESKARPKMRGSCSRPTLPGRCQGMGLVPLKRMSCYRGSTTWALSPSVKSDGFLVVLENPASDGTCIRDPENMRFVDQRWVDFVPGLYPVHIVRDSSYNVAYWNLDHRDLTYIDGHLSSRRPAAAFLSFQRLQS